MTAGKKIQFRIKSKYHQAVIDNFLNDWLEKEIKIQRRTKSDLIKFILADYYLRHENNKSQFKGL